MFLKFVTVLHVLLELRESETVSCCGCFKILFNLCLFVLLGKRDWALPDLGEYNCFEQSFPLASLFWRTPTRVLASYLSFDFLDENY